MVPWFGLKSKVDWYETGGNYFPPDVTSSYPTPPDLTPHTIFIISSPWKVQIEPHILEKKKKKSPHWGFPSFSTSNLLLLFALPSLTRDATKVNPSCWSSTMIKHRVNLLRITLNHMHNTDGSIHLKNQNFHNYSSTIKETRILASSINELCTIEWLIKKYRLVNSEMYMPGSHDSSSLASAVSTIICFIGNSTETFFSDQKRPTVLALSWFQLGRQKNPQILGATLRRKLVITRRWVGEIHRSGIKLRSPSIDTAGSHTRRPRPRNRRRHGSMASIA